MYIYNISREMGYFYSCSCLFHVIVKIQSNLDCNPTKLLDSYKTTTMKIWMDIFIFRRQLGPTYNIIH